MGHESRYFPDFGGFWVDFGGMLASKMDQKSMLSSRDEFWKRLVFPLWKSMILKDPGVEVGSQNRSKIDQKRNLTWEGILASIFHGFWWILEAKLSQVGMENRAKIDQKAHWKYDEKKKASWRRLGGPVLEPSWGSKSTGPDGSAGRGRGARWRRRRGHSLGFLRISFGYYYVYP